MDESHLLLRPAVSTSKSAHILLVGSNYRIVKNNSKVIKEATLKWRKHIDHCFKLFIFYACSACPQSLSP